MTVRLRKSVGQTFICVAPPDYVAASSASRKLQAMESRILAGHYWHVLSPDYMYG